MTDQKDTSAGNDAISFSRTIAVGLAMAAFYFASRPWLSEGAYYCIATTVLLLYLVTGPFRNYWAKPKFWGALLILFGGHAVFLLWYVNGHIVRWGFWQVMVLAAPEWLAMTLILGWILGDNYFTRNTRRERARAAQEKQSENAGDTRGPQRTSEKNN